MMEFLFGAFVGLCVYLMIDGYRAIRERRQRFDEETEERFRESHKERAHQERMEFIRKHYNIDKNI
jgi:hypothetical protein